jgi:hypothetical protein
MTSAVCTLFEGSYHLGLGALANSLYASGFRGTIYAGHRGLLPPWAKVVTSQADYSEYKPADGLIIRFIPVDAKVHLTNYKPDFMLQLWERHCADAEMLFYFDPDIVIRFPWKFFEEWASDSVALCEDINSPLPPTHPKRNAWRRLLGVRGHKMANQVAVYVNGGFVALPKEHQDFLSLWSRIITEIGEAGVNLGALNTSEDYRFWNNDQDALNITVMDTRCPTSSAGKDGMGFVDSNCFMVHAVGADKPWRVNFLKQFIAGKRPALVQREYWSHVTTPIEVFSPGKVRRKRLKIKLAALGNRFYGS